MLMLEAPSSSLQCQTPEHPPPLLSPTTSSPLAHLHPWVNACIILYNFSALSYSQPPLFYLTRPILDQICLYFLQPLTLHLPQQIPNKKNLEPQGIILSIFCFSHSNKSHVSGCMQFPPITSVYFYANNFHASKHPCIKESSFLFLL